MVLFILSSFILGKYVKKIKRLNVHRICENHFKKLVVKMSRKETGKSFFIVFKPDF